MQLAGARILISGSGRDDAPDLLWQAHRLVRALVRGVLQAGGRLVSMPGFDETATTPHGELGVRFDWTALDAAAECIRLRTARPLTAHGPLIIATTSEHTEAQIGPPPRRKLWEELLAADAIELRRLPPGWRSWALIRIEQARQADVLVTLGGGGGVEHAAREVRQQGKPIVPLDIPVGANPLKAALGGEGLARDAVSRPWDYLRLVEGKDEAAALESLAWRDGRLEPEVFAARVLEVLRSLAPPTAFCVRLQDRSQEEFVPVENFFRRVVDPTCERYGFEPYEVGRAEPIDAFLNNEIFRRLHFSGLAVVDLSGERPNAFMELGYALARPLPVVVTAKAGTQLPFDPAALPVHFWSDRTEDAHRCRALESFWAVSSAAPPLLAGTR